MAKTGDVEFNINANFTYNYMLVERDGQKAWSLEQLYRVAPSLIKEKIDMVALASPKMRLTDGNTNTGRDIASVLTEVRNLASATNTITVNGYDDQTYNVLLDPRAIRITQVLDETGRDTDRYEVAISCWGLYT